MCISCVVTLHRFWSPQVLPEAVTLTLRRSPDAGERVRKLVGLWRDRSALPQPVVAACCAVAGISPDAAPSSSSGGGGGGTKRPPPLHRATSTGSGKTLLLSPLSVGPVFGSPTPAPFSPLSPSKQPAIDVTSTWWCQWWCRAVGGADSAPWRRRLTWGNKNRCTRGLHLCRPGVR